jgi:hypothetical protein
MKKVIILLALLALSLGTFSCGGNGAGSADIPPGENPGIPSVVQLLPTHYISQTNAYIYLHAKVLDGNGIPVPNTQVIFTNMSFIGVLNPTTATTDGLGIVTVTIFSSTPGFSTVQAEVYTGAGQVRDRKTVYFTTNAILAVTMSLDVDSVPGNGNANTFTGYDESSDFILFNPPPDPDDTVEVLATVYNAGGVPIAGESVSWSADQTEAIFLRTETTTNISGQAKAVVQVTPESIRDTETHVNIMAYAGNGAANMVTLFLQPVIPETIIVTADPAIVAPEATSTITAAVTLNTGGPAPDGTTVSFTTCDAATCTALPEPECCAGCTALCGAVTPFAQTTDGATTGVTFTAPSTEDTCTIIATAGGKCGKTDVTVTTALTVQPSTRTISGVTGGVATFTIYGGIAGYTVTSSNPAIACNSTDADCSDTGDTGTWAVAASGGTFTVTVPPNTPASSVTLTVRDSVGTTFTATLTIAAGPALDVQPATITANEGEPITYTIFGGVAPYNVFSSSTAAPPDPTTVDTAPYQFDVDIGDVCTPVAPATTCTTTVTITVKDALGATKTATITVNGT